jgi:DNA-binding NarL/FixJ family response regulator
VNLDNDMSTGWRTLLVDGQTLFRDLLARILELDSRFRLVGQVDHPAVARTICQEQPPDLVVADAQLPYPGGVEFLEYALTLPATRVLVLSHSRNPLLLNHLRQLGVHGLVEKDQPLEILEEALVEVATGKRYFTAAVCQLQEALQHDPGSFSRKLNPREQQVLRLVAAGLTSKSIARELNLSPRSIETYRYRMMRKLNVENMAGLIRFALQLQAGDPAPACALPPLPSASCNLESGQTVWAREISTNESPLDLCRSA